MLAIRDILTDSAGGFYGAQNMVNCVGFMEAEGMKRGCILGWRTL